MIVTTLAPVRERMARTFFQAFTAFLAVVAIGPLDGEAQAHKSRPTKAPKTFFGIHLRLYEDGDYDRMRKNRVGTVRTAFPVSTAKQLSEAPYDWSSFDAVVEGTARAGLRLMPVLQGYPIWIPTARSSLLEGPINDAWLDYVTAVVSRYGRGGTFWAEHPKLPERPIKDWQIWNEPNSPVNWQDPSPREFGMFVAQSGRAVHRVDHRARVISGGVVADPLDSGVQAGAPYLREMLRQSKVGNQIDAVGVHPYTRSVRRSKLLLKRARRVIDAAGLKRTPIWVTEIGWGRKAPQRRYLKGSFQMAVAMRRKLDINGIVWYQWQDGADPACGWCESSGLLKESGKPKPLLRVYRKSTRSSERRRHRHGRR